ncbi:hypothetical protein PT974_06140 [Cladobotryum mycophilum]|uniref:Uncharacterized protein n=1 Tax=Cladobotryum mycophilum TaxID=491253 RepID=A0ABR0SKN8_9HYPO
MCLLTSGHCPYCKLLKPITTKNCPKYWYEYKEAVRNNDLDNKPTSEDCDYAEFETIVIKAGRCPRLQNCPSRLVWRQIQRQRAVKAEEQRRLQEKKDERHRQRLAAFAQRHFQKKPVPKMASPVPFLDACRNDALERVERTRLAVKHAEEKFRKAMEFSNLTADDVFNTSVFDSDSEDEGIEPAGPSNEDKGKKGKGKEPALKMRLPADNKPTEHEPAEHEPTREELLAEVDMDNLQEILTSVPDSPILCRLAEEPLDRNDEDVFGIPEEWDPNADDASFVTIDEDDDEVPSDNEEHLLDFVNEEYLSTSVDSNPIPPEFLGLEPSYHESHHSLPAIPEGDEYYGTEGSVVSDVNEPESPGSSIAHRMRYNLKTQLTNGLVKATSYVHPPQFIGWLFSRSHTQHESTAFTEMSRSVFDAENTVQAHNPRFMPL